MECLGRYRVLDRLASGGMADVLLARTDGIEGFERHVVLKRIRGEYARDPQFIKMFLAEARVAANLHHQHIVQVNDIGEAAGNYFFAMEYIHGEDVRAVLNAAVRMRAHVPLGVVAAIGSAAAAGLHYAHERRTADRRPLNIVHCDVSPSNILVGYDGSIKVVDFGIAKAALRGDGLPGKAPYLSPEQCTGGPIDHRSDIFSLGTVLYELATTTRLWRGATDEAVMDMIARSRAPLPRTRRPELPNELAMIILRALEPDPDRRYQTADELRIALDQFAAAANLSTSAATVAAAIKKMFGERPEPWLELAAATALPPPGARGSQRASDSALLALGTDRFGKVYDSQRAFARADTAPLPASLTHELSSARQQALTQPALRAFGARRGVRALRIAIPVAAAVIAAIVLAVVVLGHGDKSAPDVDGVQTIAAPSKTGALAVPAHAPIVAPIEVPPPAAPREMTVAPEKKAAREAAQDSRSIRAVPTVATAAPPPTTMAAPAPAPSPEPPPPTTTPASLPAPPVVPAIAAIPAPPPAAPAIPQIAPSVVSRVAREHARALAKCEGNEILRGELTVRFHVTLDGKVARPQVATTIRNPPFAACILHVLQRWRFARQPAGGAQGSYSVVFQ